MAARGAPALETVLLDLPIERALADPKYLGRALPVAAEGLQVLADQIALDLGQRTPDEVDARRPPAADCRADADRLGHVLEPEQRRAREQHHALDRVPELAHVARPAVAQEPRA